MLTKPIDTRNASHAESRRNAVEQALTLVSAPRFARLGACFFFHFVTMLSVLPTSAHAQSEAPANPVRVALLTYDNGKTAECFSANFLDHAARSSRMEVVRTLTPVALDSAQLSEYPMAIFSGEGQFRLNPDELAGLRRYVQQGGFVLASAGCSNELWADGFRRVFAEAFPDQKLKPLSPSHGLFHTLHDIKNLRARKGESRPTIFGMELNGKLRLVFAPIGVNDTASAGGDCCCCGGNEIRDAHLLNANILAYVVSH